VCWALYIIFGQKAGRAHGASASTWGMLIAATFTVPLGVALTGRGLLSPAVLPMGLAVAVLSSAFPYTLEMIALRQLTTKTFGTLMSLEPAVAALAGLLFLNERLTLTQWLAIGAVMIQRRGHACLRFTGCSDLRLLPIRIALTRGGSHRSGRPPV
jgi:inner membrane transporter RhtA